MRDQKSTERRKRRTSGQTERAEQEKRKATKIETGQGEVEREAEEER